ncbi:hypothetical protein FBU59_003899 [Linderina macrospora]|uniref:Uncharacterized protein n=1 Tax=Linderina macrospora TaxID=4868 RepID=A0ACC1J764_9FUNG|nr:hypothetical protein FBU59_003899 [Linderina macrospora]
MMHIVDEPSDFDRINKRVLESASGIYSAASVDQLFKPPSRVETANFDWFSWSLPQDTQWINLRSLKFTAGIATADCLANLVAQLPVLQVLDINCDTMVTDDATAASFVDEVARITELGEVMDPDDDSAINESLEQVSIMVKKSFDYTGLCQLVSRLPKVTEVKVHHLFIKNIQDTLRDEFEVTRNINVSAYLRTN